MLLNLLLYIHTLYRHFRFVRGTQEDSHEVLRALLDDIKTEEIEVISYLRILALLLFKQKIWFCI